MSEEYSAFHQIHSSERGSLFVSVDLFDPDWWLRKPGLYMNETLARLEFLFVTNIDPSKHLSKIKEPTVTDSGIIHQGRCYANMYDCYPVI